MTKSITRTVICRRSIWPGLLLGNRGLHGAYRRRTERHGWLRQWYGENPTYEDVVRGDRGFAETAEVKYDPARIPLPELLTDYFKVINPTSVNKQGNDVGINYRTGVYYANDADLAVINDIVAKEQKKYTKKIVTEVMPLKNYYLAEEYHQDYLDKIPTAIAMLICPFSMR